MEFIKNNKIIVVIALIFIIVIFAILVNRGNSKDNSKEVDYWKTEIILPTEDENVINEDFEIEQNQ